MNGKSLLEDDNEFASKDAFSGQPGFENNSKENEGIAPAKKGVKGKAQKVAMPPTAQPAEEVAKKANPKKASVKKEQTIEPTLATDQISSSFEKEAPVKISKRAAAAKKGTLAKATETIKEEQVVPTKQAAKKVAVKKSAAKKTLTAKNISPVVEESFVEETPILSQPVTEEKQDTAQEPAIEDEAITNQELPFAELASDDSAADEQQSVSQADEGQPSLEEAVITPEEELADQTLQDANNSVSLVEDNAQSLGSLFNNEIAEQQSPAEEESEIPQLETKETDQPLAESEAAVDEPEYSSEELQGEPVTEDQLIVEESTPGLVSQEEPEHLPFQVEDSEETSTRPSILRKVTFQVKFSTVVGQSLFVSGNHPLLGNNNYDNSFPLNYLNENYWAATLEIPETDSFQEEVIYNYVLKNIDGTYIVDWGNDKVIKSKQINKSEVLFIDSWNASSLIENTYYTEPFQEVLLKENLTQLEPLTPGSITHIFRAKAPLLSKGQALCIIGSTEELGQWNTEKPLLLTRQQGEVWHSISLDLSNAQFPLNYKYGVFDTNTSQFVEYEIGDNRVINDNIFPVELTIVSDGFAQVPYKGYKGAGVAIPVFSLRSENSFGVGEFTDLKLLVDWAKQVGLKLIQILPVNDTTATHKYTDSYPYAAISAFALHPLYLHLPALASEGDQSFIASLTEKQAELNRLAEVDYVEVMKNKWDLIKQIFPSQKESVFQSSEFKTFFDENAHWLIPYAAFSYFREQFNTSDFNTWSTNQTYDAAEIKELAGFPLESDNKISVYYYVQYHLHLQLSAASQYAHENGIIIKGDIPIGIYRNSCDAWQQPELYNMDMQAGAPPDDFAVKGQNWGFPTYNWQKMREDGFRWWKNRFKQMSYYFDAFRIDHILGFFRIWSIPTNAVEGIMGYFVPAMPVHVNEISDRGIHFDYNRFCKPFINNEVLTQVFGTGKDEVTGLFLNETTDGNFELKPEFDTQRKVEAYFASQKPNTGSARIKEGLYDLISNVILFEVAGSEGTQFHFRIAMSDTTSFKFLNGHTQHHLNELYVNYFYRRQDYYWMHEAMLKLPELKRSTNMLICGEDLGMVPDCVPGVMKELAILSLEIQRMPKDQSREFFHPNDAPYLSVVTPSTHDMSTVRGWWEEDRAATQRFYNSELGQWGTAPYFCEPWINRIIILQHLYSPAMWSIFQLQDLLGISGSLRRENPHDERINIPANPQHYWRYRMHLTLEELINEIEFTADVKQNILQSGR